MVAVSPIARPPEHLADYVVIGGGASGCVVASRLAEGLPDRRVTLLEAGPSHQGQERIADARRWPELLRSDLDYDYEIAPQSRGNELIRLARARVLGGCTSHNNCIAFRPPPSDIAVWAALAGDGWDPASVAAACDKVEARLHTERVATANPLAQAFLESAANVGYPIRELDGGGDGPGAGWFSVSMRGNRRESSATAYLGTELHNLRIETEVTARHLVIAGGRAVAVETDCGTYEAEREIIVCCGAIDTPKLLLLSGVGPAGHLRELELEAKVDLPGVGENLVDHPEGIVLWESTRTVPSEHTNLEAGLFVKVDPDAPAPDLMFHFLSMRFDDHTTARGYPTADHVFSLHPNVPRSRSKGTVRLRSADPTAQPSIDPRYFTDEDGYDEAMVVEGIRIARRLAQTDPLREWIACELAPGASVTRAAELAEFARVTSNTGYHLAGTCKMGRSDDPLAVVGPDLRVRGVAGLRVADASVFPSMISVNIAITCMMIGERAADLIIAGTD